MRFFSLLALALTVWAHPSEAGPQAYRAAKEYLDVCASRILQLDEALNSADEFPEAIRNQMERIRLQYELRLITGPSFREWKELGQFVSVPPPDYQFFSGPTLVATSDANYLLNAKRARALFAAQWRRQLSQAPDYKEWKQDLVELHFAMTGAAAGTAHQTPLYRSDDSLSSPGKFRFEIPEVALTVPHIEALEVAKHTQRWLVTNGFEAASVLRPRPIEVAGLREFLAKTNLSLAAVPNHLVDDLPDGSQYYPPPQHVPVYLGLMCSLQKRIAKQVLDFTTQLRAEDSDQRAQAQRVIQDAIADYYHAAIYSLPFNRVNNSIYLMQVNHISETIGLPAVQHGRIDMVAIRMDYQPFREYFRWYSQVYGVE